MLGRHDFRMYLSGPDEDVGSISSRVTRRLVVVSVDEEAADELPASDPVSSV